MIQGRRGLRFVQQIPGGQRIPRGEVELQRDNAIQAGVARLPDLTQSPCGNLVEQDKGTDALISIPD